jgi:hypothetical protein
MEDMDLLKEERRSANLSALASGGGLSAESTKLAAGALRLVARGLQARCKTTWLEDVILVP